MPMLKLHDTIYRKTDGWIGHLIPGPPRLLLLHTVGAKTGIARTNSLSYAKDGDAYLVVASKGGAPKAPGWYFNLKADPQVEINVGPKRMPADGQDHRRETIRTTRGCATSCDQREQLRPLRRLPEADDPNHPGHRADAARLIRKSPNEAERQRVWPIVPRVSTRAPRSSPRRGTSGLRRRAPSKGHGSATTLQPEVGDPVRRSYVDMGLVRSRGTHACLLKHVSMSRHVRRLLEQFLREQFQGLLAGGRGPPGRPRVRRRDGVDHHLVDAEVLGQLADLVGGLGGRADDRPRQARRRRRPAAAASARRLRRPRRGRAARSG